MIRIEPNMPVGAYKTYRIMSPQSTHFRPATCAEADCEHHLRGWQSTIDETTVLGQQQAHYIRKQSGRGFTEERLSASLTRFIFHAGQTCFAGGHQVRLDRPEHYLVRAGDWRGNPTGQSQTLRAQDWVDDFGEHQQRLADQLERG
ncbi:hypothetical protein [Kitasatospora indigofera]|uniref:hypothetical protein n=1 Tax=Kitasatospora indigofera TaxID=67307 RepID=UPI0036C72000